ncbi:hypothetical protein HDU96_004547, partial [Phlyctochytrium bullatum]
MTGLASHAPVVQCPTRDSRALYNQQDLLNKSLSRGAGTSAIIEASGVGGKSAGVRQRFDISIELHSEDLSVDPLLAALEFTINGQPADKFLNASAPFVDAYTSQYFKSPKNRDSNIATPFKVARLNWRDLSLPSELCEDEMDAYFVRITTDPLMPCWS